MGGGGPATGSGTRRRGIHLVGAPALAARELPADVELVGLPDVDPRAHLCRPSYVGLEAVAATLTSVARLLVAAERRAGVELVERVGPDDPGPELVGHPEDAAALLGPDAGGQPVGGVVRLGDGLRGGAEREHRDDRAEDLLLRDAVVWLTPLNTVGRNQKPWSAGRTRSPSARLPRPRPTATISSMRLELLARVDGADVGVLVQGVADAQGARRRLRRWSSSSAMFSCTRIRLPAQHTWPWLKKMPLTIPSTAWSMGASSKMMFAALPPSSRVAFFLVPAMDRAIILPTAVEPVNASLSMPGWPTIACRWRPAPVTMLTTPGGRSAWRQTSAKSSAVSGVVSAGLRTSVLPHASAGAIFHDSMSSGKFHGTTWPDDAQRLAGPARGRRGRACRPSPRGRRSAPPARGEVDVAGLLDRLAVVQASRGRRTHGRSSWRMRAIRKRYLPRSAPLIRDQTRVGRPRGRLSRPRRRRRHSPRRPRRAPPRWPGSPS